MEQDLLGRRVTDLAVLRLKEEAVILLEGPRSSGKSIAIAALAEKLNLELLDFDNSVVREDAARNPDFYTKESMNKTVLIDEYQRVPAILDSIKTRLNKSSKAGQFFLTGSTRHNALPGSVQSLTGRVHRMKIYPFSQSEMAGTAPDLLRRLLAEPERTVGKRRSRTSMESRETYTERIIRGGFPLAVNRSPRARNRWFDDYIRQTVERDIPGIVRIRNSRGLMELVRKLASQTAQILALENAASASALNISTVRDYLQLLQDVFMIEELPAWGKTLSSRSSAKPKIHFTDSGLAARLLGLTAEKMSRRDPSSLTEFGHLLETFAVSELLKEISWLDDTCLTGHWRTHDGKEVDFIIELMDGSIYGFEIKSGERIPASDFGGLAALRKYAGASFKGGFVFHLGLRAYRFDDRLYALPLSLLWEA